MKNSASQALPRPVHRGVLSIELVIILAVIVIMVIYIFANSGSLFRKNDTTMELGNAQEIMTQTRTLLKTQGGYEFSDAAKMTGTLVQFGGVPNSMTLVGDKSSGSATVINTWGGSVTAEVRLTPERSRTVWTASLAARKVASKSGAPCGRCKRAVDLFGRDRLKACYDRQR